MIMKLSHGQIVRREKEKKELQQKSEMFKIKTGNEIKNSIKLSYYYSSK